MAMHGSDSIWSETAAWVEAIGAIAAVVGSGWVAANESRATRLREERAADAAILKDSQGVFATKTAALNLAILAVTQIMIVTSCYATRRGKDALHGCQPVARS